MEEIYAFIKEKIKASGYPVEVDGREFYNDVCDEADDKEEGAYLLLIKKSDEISYEVQLEVLEKDIDMHTCKIHMGDKTYEIDFDA